MDSELAHEQALQGFMNRIASCSAPNSTNTACVCKLPPGCGPRPWPCCRRLTVRPKGALCVFSTSLACLAALIPARATGLAACRQAGWGGYFRDLDLPHAALG